MFFEELVLIAFIVNYFIENITGLLHGKSYSFSYLNLANLFQLKILKLTWITVTKVS